MRRGFVPLVIIIVIAVLGVVGFTFVRSFQRGIPNPEDKVFMEEFEKVEIAQLVADPESWDGKKVEVSGSLSDRRNLPAIFCWPGERGPNPEFLDRYQMADYSWGLSDSENGVAIKFADTVTGISNLFESSANSQVTVRGVAHYIEVEGECNRNTIYKSIYIEIMAAETSMPEEKSLPSVKPTN